MILLVVAFLMLCGLLSYISVADPWKGTCRTCVTASPGRGWAVEAGLGRSSLALACSRPWMHKRPRAGRKWRFKGTESVLDHLAGLGWACDAVGLLPKCRV